MSSILFEYAVIYNPSKKESKDGGKAELVVKPTTILAKSEKEANFVAARSVPETFADRLDQLEIAVRPF